MHPLLIQKEQLQKGEIFGGETHLWLVQKETFDLTEVRCWQSPLGQDSEEDQHHFICLQKWRLQRVKGERMSLREVFHTAADAGLVTLVYRTKFSLIK